MDTDHDQYYCFKWPQNTLLYRAYYYILWNMTVTLDLGIKYTLKANSQLW